jgi:geranylgeranyl pyrophosphate synthase
LELASETDRQTILDLASGDDRRAELLVPYLERYDAIAYTRRCAHRFALHARRRLEALSPSRERDILAAMTEFVVSRAM